MKTMLKALAVVLFVSFLMGCKEERQPEPEESIYKSLEGPVDRSKSKEY